MSNLQLSNQVYALSNASQFGVSYSTYAGKKNNIPVVYTLEATNGKINIYFHKSENVKNEITQVNEAKHVKQSVGEIRAIPGSLFIQLTEDLLPNKLIFDDIKFHWEVLVNRAIPYWVNGAVDLVEQNKIAPVWLIVAKLIKLTNYDNSDTLSIHEVSTVKPFTESQWWDVLQQCSLECQSIPQFKQALKTRPVLTPTDETEVEPSTNKTEV